MNSLPVQLVLLIVWLGLGAYGTYMLLQKGYRVNSLKILAYYVAPVVAILFLIINQIQPLDASWPGNLPGVVINIALGIILLIVSPALLIAAFLVPTQKDLDISARALQRDAFVRMRSRVLLIGAIFLALLMPLLALSLFRTAAPSELRYDSVISVIINGLFSGALFALIALGYTLVYGIVELINFAHGDVFMMGSLVGFTVINLMLGAESGRPVKADTSVFMVILAIVLALIISMVFCGFLNYLINRIAYKRLRNAPRLAPLISAIGVSFILQNIGLYLISSAPKGYPVKFPNATRVANTDLVSDILDNHDSLITIPVTGILVVVGVSILLIGLSYLINQTKIGKAMRAVAQNREAAALMGISIERTISFAFIIGGALAGAAGVIYGVYQVQGTVRYDLGFQNGLFAFTAAVLGGIGNVNGAVLGGLFIGLIYSLSQSSFFGLSASYLDLSIWAPVAVFGVLVLVMIFRPTGILGENVQEKV
jgi:branched-chain amino acid transport system permease protein